MENPVNDFVCASIRRHRMAKGLRLVDMARRTGIQLGSYSCLETNRYRISLVGEFHAKPQSRKKRKDKKIKGFLAPLDSGIEGLERLIR